MNPEFQSPGPAPDQVRTFLAADQTGRLVYVREFANGSRTVEEPRTLTEAAKFWRDQQLLFASDPDNQPPEGAADHEPFQEGMGPNLDVLRALVAKRRDGTDQVD
jgi:hypothetical protein